METRDPIAMMRQSARRLAVVRSPELDVCLVYALQRVPSPVFLRLATTALAQLAATQEDQEERTRRLAGCTTDDERAKVEGELAEGQARRALELAEDPARATELLETAMVKINDVVRAAVHGTGIALPGVAEGLVPVGTPIAEVCEQLGTLSDSKEAVYLRPINWGEFPVELIEESVRQELMRLAIDAFVSPREVASFRDGQGGAGARGSAGEAVRRPPVDVAPAGRSGGRPARRSRGSRGDAGG